MASGPSVTNETLSLVYRDVGQLLTKKQKTDLANKWYTRSLEINPQNTECYYSRSVNSANAGKGKESLNDAQIALRLNPRSTKINLQEASSFVHCNDFEKALMSLHNNSKKFNSQKIRAFVQEIEALEGAYVNSLGLEFGQYANSKSKVFETIGKQIEAEKMFEEKPLWKKLRERNECDVVSIRDTKEEFIHPRESERRKLACKSFYQIYAGRSWIDFIFLNKLRFNKTLFLPQTPYSTQQMQKSLNDNFKAANFFCKMLHAQDPVYHARIKACPKAENSEEHLQTNLYRIQYQTRRNIFSILEHTKKLRKLGKLHELINYVEHVMCIYPATKIKRVIPWKYEFLYEIYNTVGLAYCDDFQNSPIDDDSDSFYKRILSLLKVEKPKEKQNVDYIFGDKTTFQEPNAKDYGFIRYKNHIKKLENWLRIAKYPIESIFVLYQISLVHLKRGKYKDCLLFITRCRTICEDNGNDIWKFLSNLMIVQINALQLRIQQNIAQINRTILCAKPLNNDRINSNLATLMALHSQFLKYQTNKVQQNNKGKATRKFI